MREMDAFEQAYKNGYAAGMKAAEEKIVYCKECKHLMFSDCYGECKKGHLYLVSPDDFCSYGERKVNE